MTGNLREITLQRRLDELEVLADMIATYCAHHRLDKEIEYIVNLAAEELFTNMVKYTPTGTGMISFSIECDEDKLIATFVDRGVPKFDIRQAPSSAGDIPLHERRIGGLGLHLVKEMIDEIDYSYRDGNGIITLIKHIKDKNAENPDS